MNIFGGNMKKIIVFVASGVLLFYCGMNLEKFIAGDFHTLKSEQTVVATTFTQAQEEKTSTQSSNKKKKVTEEKDSPKEESTQPPIQNPEAISLREPFTVMKDFQTEKDAFTWRNLEPAILVNEQVNHLLFREGDIYAYPNQQAQKLSNAKQFHSLMAVSRQTVKSAGKLWYQVAFPDEVLGWVCEDQVTLHNEDYYFYQTGGVQPDLAQVKNLNIEVSISKKRVYVKSGQQTVYTMLCQTARNGYLTPTGTYHVNEYRAKSFWSTFGGADYAVGWKDGGLYLFHSVDKETDSGPYAKSQGLKLGVEGDGVSHGCIQLAIPDAKWFFEQLPTGTLVTINK